MRVRLAAPLVALAVLAAAPCARAQGTSSSGIAEGLFRQAQKLMAEGKVHEACEAFDASQKAEPAVGSLLNLAACHEKEGRTATAWAEFDEALAIARKLEDRPREAYARAHVAALEKRLRRLTLSVAAPTADLEIAIDGTSLARAAWSAGVPLDPGEHEIRATAPKKTPYSQKFAFGGEPGTERIDVPALIALVDEAAPSKTEAPPPPNEAPVPPAARDTHASSNSRRTAGFVSGGVGVVALGVATFFTVSSFGAAGDRDNLCPTGKPCPSEQAYRDASDAHDRAKSQQAIGLAAGGLALVALGVGAWLIFSSSEQPTAAKIGLAPRPGGAELGGTVAW